MTSGLSESMIQELRSLLAERDRIDARLTALLAHKPSSSSISLPASPSTGKRRGRPPKAAQVVMPDEEDDESPSRITTDAGYACIECGHEWLSNISPTRCLECKGDSVVRKGTV